ncbi:hypothetical protein [Lignipirellula cremea]|uniref:Uncharacterized protein n=1 Tax=Lignipirellula cremea TaxID=2528010 RepID=A0A518DRP8_9BACT|nr:hypothetical protein [Lignipirellula cremea]QDU94518.1 hypothetical protein Pla8534_23090 [Lignipirellula cremea]
MTRRIYRFDFPAHVDIKDVQASMVLALFAVESLYGRARIRLEAGQYIDREAKSCVIDADTEVGTDLARLFTGFLSREYGDDGFRVSSVETSVRHTSQPSSATNRQASTFCD